MVQMVRDYGNQINWNVGGLFVHDKFIHILVDYLEKLGYENPIKNVFGTVPCIMSGGISPILDPPMKAIKDVICDYNKRDICCNIDFSNVYAEEISFMDEKSNTILEYLNKCESVKNGVIVSDPRYAEYIRSNYDNLNVIASYMKPMFEVGLGNDSVNYYNNLLNTFDYVYVNPYKVNDIEFLEGLHNKYKVIFDVNSRDLPNDPLTKNFYSAHMLMSIKSVAGEEIEEEKNKLNEIIELQNKTRSLYPLAGTSLSESSIENLLRLGFVNMSIQGIDSSGISFIRDLGDYVFVSYLFTRISQSILQTVV